MFGTTRALRPFSQMTRTDYIRVPGRLRVEDPDHRFETLEIRAPLFTAIGRATTTVRDELLQSFSLLAPDDGAWQRQRTHETISDEESRALVFVRELGAIDNAAYRSSNRTDTLNASGHLRRLRDLDLLGMKGAGSRTYYVPGPRFLAAPLAPDVRDTPRQAGPDGRQLPPDTHQLPANTHQLSADTHQLVDELPESLRASIPRPGTKPRRSVLRALIRGLCEWRPLSARELATVLGGRDHKHLVREYLSPMIQEGLLACTIPEMENHPDQCYTVPATEPAGDGSPR